MATTVALDAQELRCIELACAHLGEIYGGTWRMTRELDAENPSTSSPEVEVSNDTNTAAIEVKGLTVAELERYNNCWNRGIVSEALRRRRKRSRAGQALQLLRLELGPWSD